MILNGGFTRTIETQQAHLDTRAHTDIELLVATSGNDVLSYKITDKDDTNQNTRLPLEAEHLYIKLYLFSDAPQIHNDQIKLETHNAEQQMSQECTFEVRDVHDSIDLAKSGPVFHIKKKRGSEKTLSVRIHPPLFAHIYLKLHDRLVALIVDPISEFHTIGVLQSTQSHTVFKHFFNCFLAGKYTNRSNINALDLCKEYVVQARDENSTADACEVHNALETPSSIKDCMISFPKHSTALINMYKECKRNIFGFERCVINVSNERFERFGSEPSSVLIEKNLPVPGHFATAKVKMYRQVASFDLYKIEDDPLDGPEVIVTDNCELPFSTTSTSFFWKQIFTPGDDIGNRATGDLKQMLTAGERVTYENEISHRPGDISQRVHVNVRNASSIDEHLVYQRCDTSELFQTEIDTYRTVDDGGFFVPRSKCAQMLYINAPLREAFTLRVPLSEENRLGAPYRLNLGNVDARLTCLCAEDACFYHRVEAQKAAAHATDTKLNSKDCVYLYSDPKVLAFKQIVMSYQSFSFLTPTAPKAITVVDASSIKHTMDSFNMTFVRANGEVHASTLRKYIVELCAKSSSRKNEQSAPAPPHGLWVAQSIDSVVTTAQVFTTDWGLRIGVPIITPNTSIELYEYVENGPLAAGSTYIRTVLASLLKALMDRLRKPLPPDVLSLKVHATTNMDYRIRAALVCVLKMFPITPSYGPLPPEGSIYEVWEGASCLYIKHAAPIISQSAEYYSNAACRSVLKSRSVNDQEDSLNYKHCKIHESTDAKLFYSHILEIDENQYYNNITVVSKFIQADVEFPFPRQVLLDREDAFRWYTPVNLWRILTSRPSKGEEIANRSVVETMEAVVRGVKLRRNTTLTLQDTSEMIEFTVKASDYVIVRNGRYYLQAVEPTKVCDATFQYNDKVYTFGLGAPPDLTHSTVACSVAVDRRPAYASPQKHLNPFLFLRPFPSRDDVSSMLHFVQYYCVSF